MRHLRKIAGRVEKAPRSRGELLLGLPAQQFDKAVRTMVAERRAGHQGGGSVPAC